MICRLVLVTAVALALSPINRTAAYVYCNEPTEPDCQSRSWTFEDEYAFQRCRSEVESFVEETRDYVACLMQAGEEAQDHANDVIDEFNCRARGGIVY